MDFTLFDSIGSILEMNRGIKMQESAAKYAGAGYRQQAAVNRELAEYNIALDKLDLENQLGVFSRNISKTVSTQRNQMATTGASITSKSFMQVHNETLDQAVRTVVNARNNNKLQADHRRYEAAVSGVNLENQARMAEYQAKANVYYSKQRQTQLLPSLFNQLGGLFGG